MKHFEIITQKLEQFISRFYTNELIKGGILFFTIGLLYFLLTLLIEHLLWLNTTYRALLFWLFVLVEIGLIIKFIAIPTLKLFKLQKGIPYKTASKIIGTHFPEVGDKLLNVLQLKAESSNSNSELLLASIEQKSLELNPIPFKLAVNFNTNLKYLKYACVPVFILLLSFFTGHFSSFSDSYKRVVDYKTAYEPPAPFQFKILNDNLTAIEGEDFKLTIEATGDIIPENAQIRFNDNIYVLRQVDLGVFEYVFTKPHKNIDFNIQSNDVSSKTYTLNITETPSLVNFEMLLDYPSYTKKPRKVLKGTGHTTIPEGTKITWELKTKGTEHAFLYAKDTLIFKSDAPNSFRASKSIYNNYDYTLSTSNKALKNYENLAFRIDVVKDEYPEIKLEVKKDTTDLESLYFYGQVSDDYGLHKLQLVYYPSNREDEKQFKTIPISNENISEFIEAFPNTIDVEKGISYNLYFEIFDNDRVNHFKKTKSNTFSYRKRTEAEETEKTLNEQEKTIEDIDKSLDAFKKQDEDLKKLTQLQKEKANLEFNDKKNLENFFKRQEEQEQMIKNFNKKIKESLEKDEDNDSFKKDLKKRLDEHEKAIKENEKLLEELQKLQDKISKEELANKLEKAAKQNKNKKRSLEQLLELTKRFYIQQKLKKLRSTLEELEKDQRTLSEKDKNENTEEKQGDLNKRFEDFKKAIEELEEESKSLKKPIEIPRDKPYETEIDNAQEDAKKELNKKNSDMQKTQKSQKKAADKMKKLLSLMKEMQGGMQQDQEKEDLETLRQILDNLVFFSFEQEKLMDTFISTNADDNMYASQLRKQQDLREHFRHIDDSLFALSLRQPKISEYVNNEISEVYYNVDHALERLAEREVYKAVSNQQFTVTSANNLADFLSNVFDQMKNSLSIPLKGDGKGESQLPDIIMSQEQINEQMKEGLKKDEKGKPKDEGQNNKEGEKGKGKKSGEKESEEGSGGKEGKDSKEGSGEGKKGNNGDGNESDDERLFEIYKQQQQLRQELKNRLEKAGINAEDNKLVKAMEEIELELLNNGITNQTLEKMINLKHQLLKMKNASFKQGKEEKRKSETNQKDFNNNVTDQIFKAKEYFKTTEILNRQSLPLKDLYKQKVKTYFKTKE